MTHRGILLIAVAAGVFVTSASATLAQNAGAAVGTSGVQAPGFNTGGLNAEGIPVAPGAAGGGMVEQIGPGGVLLAPGPAGRLSGSPAVSTPRQPRSRSR